MQRTLLASSIAATLISVLAIPTAWSQSSMDKQLSSDRFTIISPFTPGGPTDTLARILSEGLGKRYAQTAVVENVPGAGGNIAMDKVRRAKGDGHTLLVVAAGNLTVNPALIPKFPFDIQRDFALVTMLAKTPNVLVAAPSANLKNARDLVALAKSKPLSYATPGVGTGLHMAGELFKQQAGVELLHVPYKGSGQALNDVMGGVVPLMFSNLSATLPFLESGKLVALGVTESARSPIDPKIPTLAEQGIEGVLVTSWYGLIAPASTPQAVVDQLAKDASEILSRPDVKDRLKVQGMTEATLKPADFAAYVRGESAMWAKIIKDRNIVAD